MTLLDLASRNGLAAVAEVLTQTNEILLDAVWVEANGATGHKFLERTSLPSGAWRKLNDGVGYEKSAAREKTETPGMLESFSKVDKALVELAANPAEFRFSELRGHTLNSLTTPGPFR